MPEAIKDWSLTGLKEKLIKFGAKLASRGRRSDATTLQKPPAPETVDSKLVRKRKPSALGLRYLENSDFRKLGKKLI